MVLNFQPDPIFLIVKLSLDYQRLYLIKNLIWKLVAAQVAITFDRTHIVQVVFRSRRYRSSFQALAASLD